MEVRDVGQEAEREQTPRRPYWIVAVALFAVVLVGLLAAFALDRRFRPRVGVDTAPQANIPAATGAPALQPLTPAATRPSPTSLAASPTVGVTLTPPSAVRPTESALAREIEAAYLRYWQVRTQAFLDLDTSRLGEVMMGDELARTEKYVQDLRAEGRAAKMDVEHRTVLAKVTPDEAIVYDEYLNKSVFVDVTTKQEQQTSALPETVKVSFFMRKIDGQWKVTGGVRHD